MEVMTETKTLLTEKEREATRKAILYHIGVMTNLGEYNPDAKILAECYKKLDGTDFLKKVDFLQNTSLIDDWYPFPKNEYERLGNIEKYCANENQEKKERKVG